MLMKLQHNKFLKKKISKNGFWITSLYYTTLIVGIIAPFTALPQILKIFIEQNAAGVSLLSWSLFVLFAIPFIIWGIVQRDAPIAVTYSLWATADLVVVIGVLIYG